MIFNVYLCCFQVGSKKACFWYAHQVVLWMASISLREEVFTHYLYLVNICVLFLVLIIVNKVYYDSVSLCLFICLKIKTRKSWLVNPAALYGPKRWGTSLQAIYILSSMLIFFYFVGNVSLGFNVCWFNAHRYVQN